MSKAGFKSRLRARVGEDCGVLSQPPVQPSPPVRPEPTIEQLARFAAVYTFGPGYSEFDLALTRAVLDSPLPRMLWLARHRQMSALAAGMGAA